MRWKGKKSVSILVNNIQPKQPVSEAQLVLIEEVLQSGLRMYQKENAEVSVILVDNDYIQVLNRDYRGYDQPTDVLSFAMNDEQPETPVLIPDESPGFPVLLGDIFISVEKALEHAESYGHSPDREFCYLAIHGLLHLLGFDHQNPQETARMRQAEEEILAAYTLQRPV
jgi:probable rRNA maturation factor